MFEDYSGVIIGLTVGLLVCAGLYFIFKRPKAPSESARVLPKQNKQSSSSLPKSKASIAGAQPAQRLPPRASGNPELIIKLRQNLRLKVMSDEAKIDRLIDFERKYNPNGSEEELMQAAIDRWEDDNR